MRTCVALMVALAIAGSVVVAADDPPKTKAAPQDPQAKFEPKSGPGVGQKYLERFVGDWVVTKSFYPRAGEPIHAQGTCRQTMIHAGRFLQSDFTFGEGEHATSGMGMIGFEPATGLFTSFWTDSRQTGMSVRRSKDRFDGEQIVLYSKSLDETAQETRKSKTISRVEPGGRKIVHTQYAISPEGEERLMMDLVMTRKTETP